MKRLITLLMCAFLVVGCTKSSKTTQSMVELQTGVAMKNDIDDDGKEETLLFERQMKGNEAGSVTFSIDDDVVYKNASEVFTNINILTARLYQASDHTRYLALSVTGDNDYTTLCQLISVDGKQTIVYDALASSQFDRYGGAYSMSFATGDDKGVLIRMTFMSGDMGSMNLEYNVTYQNGAFSDEGTYKVTKVQTTDDSGSLVLKEDLKATKDNKEVTVPKGSKIVPTQVVITDDQHEIQFKVDDENGYVLTMSEDYHETRFENALFAG